MGGIEESLEDRARAIARRNHERLGTGPIGQLEREIALASGRLDRLKETNRMEMAGICRDESAIRLELRSIQSYQPRIFEHPPKIREDMRKRLASLKKERRRLRREHEKAMGEHHEQLFRLFRMHEALRGSA